MIQVKFKNLDRSSMIRESVIARVEPLVDKFIDLNKSKILITLEMENSPLQAGPDLFKVKIHVSGGRYRGITVEKADLNLYVALADVMDHMLEILNRHGDRVRVKQRKRARQIAKMLDTFEEEEVSALGEGRPVFDPLFKVS